jgi:hypothetical protein
MIFSSLQESFALNTSPHSFTDFASGSILLTSQQVRLVILGFKLSPCSESHGITQFLMGLRLECIKTYEQSLLLEKPLLKILLLEDERSDWVNPVFDERENCGEFHTLFPMLLEQASTFFEYCTKEINFSVSTIFLF